MYNPGQGIRLRGSARTNTGKVRNNNEDRVHLWTRGHNLLAIVADGMGGAVAGEEASRIAVEKIHDGLVDPQNQPPDKFDLMDEETLSDMMRQAITAANGTIVDRAETDPQLKGMGTTITMAFVRSKRVVIGHVGDSRAYLVDGADGHVIQITSDHSFVQALVAAGHISQEEAEEHPMKNVLYRALGQGREIEVDVYYEGLRVGDRLVICSDGLTLHVKPEEIAQVTLAADNPDESSQKLIDLANQRGGRDNVSVIVIQVEEDRAPAGESAEKTSAYEYTDEDTLIIGYTSSESKITPLLDDAALTQPKPPGVPDNAGGKPDTGKTPHTTTFGEGRDTSKSDRR